MFALLHSVNVFLYRRLTLLHDGLLAYYALLGLLFHTLASSLNSLF
jgi:hypothetical protein